MVTIYHLRENPGSAAGSTSGAAQTKTHEDLRQGKRWTTSAGKEARSRPVK
jgi:hypothetical protein